MHPQPLMQMLSFSCGIDVVESSLLGFFSVTDYGVFSYLRTAAELMNSMITINPSPSTNTLRIVKFIVGE